MIEPLPSSAKNITIDGVGLHSVDRADVQNHIIAMFQESVFLPEFISLRRKLDPRQLSDPDECLAVLQIVGFDHLACVFADW
jgi:hypothetical protein